MMKLFFREKKENVEKSKEVCKKLKQLNPHRNDDLKQKIREKIRSAYHELEDAEKVRDRAEADRLRPILNNLYYELSDAEQDIYKEKDLLTRELSDLNTPMIEKCNESLFNQIREVERMRNMEMVNRVHNPAILQYTYTVKTNFKKINDTIAILVAARKKIQDMAILGSVDEIEGVYLTALESVLEKYPCDEERQISEVEFGELRSMIDSGLQKASDYDTYWTYMRYFPK